MSFRRFSRRLAQSWAPGGPARVVVRSTDSTNLLARRVAAAYRADGGRPVAASFVAHHQSAGRGRGDRRWQSLPGEGVYASLLLPTVRSSQLTALPLLVAVGLADAVQPLVRRRVTLRWPNDLLIGRRKLGGILIEATGGTGGEATAVVGFGINCDRPPVARATSIREERPAAARRESIGPEELADVAVRLISGVEKELEGLDDAAAAARRYAAASAHHPGDRLSCRTPEGVVEGRFRGFDRRGFLRLETAEGERSMGTGDLVWAGE